MSSRPKPETALCEDEVTRVTAAAPFAHVAIETATGPHVTPVLFSAGAGRVWFVVARDTLKARVLARRPRAAILLRDGERAVMLRGEVHLLDPLRPGTWTQAPREAASAPLGLQTFALRNPRELFGFALDTLEARAAPLGSGLVLAALEPRAVAVARGSALELEWGDWPGPPARRTRSRGATTTPGHVPRGLPRPVAGLPRRDGDAILGWTTGDGPVALPARWKAETSSALVSRAAARLAGVAGSAPACVAFDAADRRRPTGKRGVMLRGPGTARTHGATTAVTLDAERATWWLGFETGTAR